MRTLIAVLMLISCTVKAQPYVAFYYGVTNCSDHVITIDSMGSTCRTSAGNLSYFSLVGGYLLPSHGIFIYQWAGQWPAVIFGAGQQNTLYFTDEGLAKEEMFGTTSGVTNDIAFYGWASVGIGAQAPVISPVWNGTNVTWLTGQLFPVYAWVRMPDGTRKSQLVKIIKK
jgi:hypothetical protein